MARSGRITLIALILGAILFAAARGIFEHADVNSIALVIAVMSLVLAILVDLLLAYFTAASGHEHKEVSKRANNRRRVHRPGRG
jgi:hypothetical protein